MTYLVFAGQDYYPNRGADDYKFSARSVADAKRKFARWFRTTRRFSFTNERPEWAQICRVSRGTLTKVLECDIPASLSRNKPVRWESPEAPLPAFRPLHAGIKGVRP